MNATRPFAILAWIALPAVMYGGYAPLSFLTHNGLDEFRQTFFRAGHAHAGVLLLLALLYHSYLSRTTISNPLKLAASSVLLIGILAQPGGFFVHMAIGEPGTPSLGTMTTVGAVLLAAAMGLLVYALISAWNPDPREV